MKYRCSSNCKRPIARWYAFGEPEMLLVPYCMDEECNVGHPTEPDQDAPWCTTEAEMIEYCLQGYDVWQPGKKGRFR